MAAAYDEKMPASSPNRTRCVVFRSKTGKFSSKASLNKSVNGVNLPKKGKKRCYNELDEDSKIPSSSPRKTRRLRLVSLRNLYWIRWNF